jgi:hypothetical protein
MATFNGEAHIRDQIRSILSQDLDDLELVVSDDGSTDKTLVICRELAAGDRRVRILPPHTGQPGHLRNFERALKATRGCYIAFSDQDDLWDPEKLSLLVAALENEPTRDLALCDLRVVNDDGKTFAPSFNAYQRLRARSGKPFRELLYRNFVTGGASMITDRLRSLALPFPGGCLYHDWWLATVAAAQGGIIYVDRPAMAYRQHDNNVLGASGAGLGRLRTRLTETSSLSEAAADRLDLDRVMSYRERLDAIATSPARLAELDEVQRTFEAFVNRRKLGPIARLRMLRVWLRYMIRPEPAEALAASARILAPDLTARLMEASRNRARRRSRGKR